MNEVEIYLNENKDDISFFEIGNSYVVIHMKNGDRVYIDTYTNDRERDVVLIKNNSLCEEMNQ